MESGPSINHVMPERGGGSVRMTNNFEGCLNKEDVGGGGGPKIA